METVGAFLLFFFLLRVHLLAPRQKRGLFDDKEDEHEMFGYELWISLIIMD